MENECELEFAIHRADTFFRARLYLEITVPRWEAMAAGSSPEIEACKARTQGLMLELMGDDEIFCV